VYYSWIWLIAALHFKRCGMTWLSYLGGIPTDGRMENELFVSLRPWGCFSPVHTHILPNLQYRES
jgi:hypothetical protein